MNSRLKTTILAIAMAVVITLMWLSNLSGSTVLFYLLFPGAALSLLITGVHGGTKPELIAAMITFFLVNTLTYWLLCMGIFIARARLKERNRQS